jgi:DNA polymerase-3 subunit epsilon
MGERLGLRLRFALFFAALALGGIALIAAGLWFGHARAGGEADGYVIAGLVGGFGLLGLAALIGLLFDENVAKPILALAADLHTRARSDVSAEIDTEPARYLGALAPAAQAIHAALAETRASLETALAEKMALVTRDKALLEALLRELADGVVVISADGRILLYNRVAVSLLGQLGLDRPLSGYLRTDPVMAAIAELEAANGPQDPVTFLTAPVDGGRLLGGAVSNVEIDDERFGHVILFRDTTEDLRTHGALERLLRDTIEGARRPASAMGAVLDVLENVPDMGAEERTTFNASLRDELGRLSQLLSQSAAREAELSQSHWPIRDTAIRQVFDALALRVSVPIHVEPTEVFARCDGFAVTEILGRVAEALHHEDGYSDLALSAAMVQGELRLQLSWSGPTLPIGTLEEWLAKPLAPAYGAYTARDAIAAHRSEIWVEPAPGGARIVLPLRAAAAPSRQRIAAPLDFYDFNIPTRVDPDLLGRSLTDLSFIVFDTETTGLDTRRDEIVQIAGARILGGRLLRGETFDRLVNPGRPIPRASIDIHGITDEQVAEAPGVMHVAADFAAFCEGSVLVAHNAAFDLAFLERIRTAGGPAIEQPALCTARLSSRLFPHTGDHTLDGLADRFGIEIPLAQRHTALGDSLATAEVMLKMLPLLEERGVVTLNDALAWQSAS